jgi:hypothetical protein
MSDQITEALTQTSAPPPAMNGADTTAVPDLDTELGNIFDRNHVTNGADRENGRFVSPDPEKREQEKPSETEGASSPPVTQSEGEQTEAVVAAVAPPPTWQHKTDQWAKLPADMQAVVAEIENGLQTKLSDMGRQLSTVRPVADVLKANEHLYNQRQVNGRPVSAHEAVAFLFGAQERLDNPATRSQELVRIIDSYGARQELASLLGVQSSPDANTQALLREITGLKQQLGQNANPQQITALIDQKINETRAVSEAQATFTAFAAKNPLVSQIPDDVFVDFIGLARKRMPETASYDAVLERAYDMAVNADPALRVKSAAKAAPVVDVKKAEEAERATSVNLKSTSTGKDRPLSLDDELSRQYDRLNPDRR